MAQQSGALFENQVLDKLSNYKIEIVSQPDFYCHFDLPRKGDFLIFKGDKKIHVECKQLGNVQSHFDKLSHCLFNLCNGCYGKDFWLIYDYAKDSGRSALKKINHLITTCEKIKKQVLVQGINFELIHLDDLKDTMKLYHIDERR